MAKIDTSTIEGYDSMTPEQKIAALEAFETPDPDYSGYVPKATFDKTATDLANLKKEQRAKLSEDERKQAERDEEITNLRTQLQELQTRETTANYIAKLVEQGYEPDLAADTAAALVAGDMTKVFANQRKFLDAYAEQVAADQLKKTPRPPAGGSNGADYQKMIDDALEAGDDAKAAYYIRLQETAKKS